MLIFEREFLGFRRTEDKTKRHSADKGLLIELALLFCYTDISSLPQKGSVTLCLLYQSRMQSFRPAGPELYTAETAWTRLISGPFCPNWMSASLTVYMS